METSTCRVCGATASRKALFCPGCTAPLTVASLASLTEDDKVQCLAALGEILADSLSKPSDENLHDAEMFSSYLSAVWLRPETALIQYGEAMGLNRISLPQGPWMDLGCGDGVHSAIYSGWRFAPEFDVFQSLDLAARDIFDHFDSSRFSAQIAQEGRRIELGIDIKPTAVERSKALGVFDRVERSDVTALPADSGSMAVVFSNMLRDLGPSLPGALSEVRRVMRNDGRLVISAMTPAYRNSLYFAPKALAAAQEGNVSQAEKLLLLDRGRSVFCQQQLSEDEWKVLLAKAGLELVEVAPIVGQSVIRFWDVGFRPFSISLIAQADKWRTEGVLGAVKPPAVKALQFALNNMATGLLDGEPCMHLLVARKV